MPPEILKHVDVKIRLWFTYAIKSVFVIINYTVQPFFPFVLNTCILFFLLGGGQGVPPQTHILLKYSPQPLPWQETVAQYSVVCSM